MDQSFDKPSPLSFLGASAVDSGEAGDLPLVVWLRGDEPHCAEFVLDADEVMALLNIRRSRLTQISGRELRVGRMRRGRYVSPMYRPEDVEAYGNWTRATASHVKSSTLLSEAAEDLKRQGAGLADSIEETLRKNASDGLRALNGEFAALRREFPAVDGRLQALEVLVRRGFTEQQARLEQGQAERAKQGVALQLIGRELGELAAVCRLLREDLAANDQKLAETRAELQNLATTLEPAVGPIPVRKPGRAGPRRLKALARKVLGVDPPGTSRQRLARHRRPLAQSRK